ncbi:MAG TPA: general secretion pathway protein GspD [Gallionellaceae bacterium]|nr:general secretion pathway protein GspD [Gallionellaceae bacterium]
MNQAVQQSVQPAEVNNALLPPLSVEMPAVEDKPLEPRFDLVVSATPVQQVFMAIVSGTRYSMLLHPEVEGSISLNLKDVTVFEALEAIREMYGYDYKMSGDRIYVQPLTMQTRIFQVNYLTGSRAGTSSVRVTSSALSDSSSGSTGTGAATNQGATIVGGGDKALKFERGNDNSSKITTTTSSDFWDELSNSLSILVGKEDGRSVVISPMSGVIVVRAMPDELKNVAAYLKASQISIERQVILEAKIIEVQLNVGFQSGVNWGAFKNNPNSRTSIGQLSPGATLSMNGSMTNGAVTSTPGTDLSLAATAAGQAAGSLFGLAFQTSNFAALLSFLESQGNVHVLSSPRIATLNNQKAVLKVGTDEFFVTEISGGTQATANVAGTAPTVKVQPFFSGIALDVTPRIDQNNEIILHVHPSVSTVSTVNKTLNLGTGVGTYNLPLASSSVSETDSIVRARDGQIVAIGGLMRQATISDQSGLPGMPKQVFGQTSKTSEKRELVILLKPTVVDNDKDWSQDITGSRDRVGGLSGQGGRP